MAKILPVNGSPIPYTSDLPVNRSQDENQRRRIEIFGEFIILALRLIIGFFLTSAYLGMTYYSGVIPVVATVLLMSAMEISPTELYLTAYMHCVVMIVCLPSSVIPFLSKLFLFVILGCFVSTFLDPPLRRLSEGRSRTSFGQSVNRRNVPLGEKPDEMMTRPDWMCKVNAAVKQAAEAHRAANVKLGAAQQQAAEEHRNAKETFAAIVWKIAGERRAVVEQQAGVERKSGIDRKIVGDADAADASESSNTNNCANEMRIVDYWQAGCVKDCAMRNKTEFERFYKAMQNDMNLILPHIADLIHVILNLQSTVQSQQDAQRESSAPQLLASAAHHDATDQRVTASQAESEQLQKTLQKTEQSSEAQRRIAAPENCSAEPRLQNLSQDPEWFVGELLHDLTCNTSVHDEEEYLHFLAAILPAIAEMRVVDRKQVVSLGKACD